MIIFDLSCENSHPFEGWFASADDFEQQLADRMVHCPVCSSADIRRVPSLVHLSSAGEVPAVAKSEEKSAMPSARHPLALYHQLVTALVASSEDVGTSFAEEARRIHYEEVTPRPIHGQSSDEEFQELLEEGIEVWRLPSLRKVDLN